MEDKGQFQIQITVVPELADSLRARGLQEGCDLLDAVLRQRNASLKCQFDVFADYVEEAEHAGRDQYPLYQWTKDTIGNPQEKGEVPEVAYGVRGRRTGLRRGNSRLAACKTVGSLAPAREQVTKVSRHAGSRFNSVGIDVGCGAVVRPFPVCQIDRVPLVDLLSRCEHGRCPSDWRKRFSRWAFVA
ncbi:hypothetical protein OKW41_003083 [Paraburkholderia sp. UCT70]|uniref:hypothetical protein n=1 Tax=Paraburkholderia sp. UCT70 TaxID=2991068 RepID=UPI003D1DD58B